MRIREITVVLGVEYSSGCYTAERRSFKVCEHVLDVPSLDVVIRSILPGLGRFGVGDP